MFHIAICDDDEMICRQIKQLIEQHTVPCKIEMFNSGEDLIANQKNFHIIFLDIQMSGLNGIETARKIRNSKKDSSYSPIIIIITALDSHMQDAFDVEAFNYILKPIDKQRFDKIFSHATTQISSRSKEKFLLIKNKGVSKNVFLKDINYIDCFKKKVYIHTSQETYESYELMENLEKQLGSVFFRCHRSVIVNFEYITSYDSKSITLKDGSCLSLAKPQYPNFVKAFMRYAQNGGAVNV